MARILVIDNEDIIRDLLVNILERAGYETITASSGKDGMKIQREYPADLIVADIFLPEKEGIETIMELRRNFQDVKIITMFGGGILDVVAYLEFAKTTDNVKTLTKPIYLKELLQTVHEILK